MGDPLEAVANEYRSDLPSITDAIKSFCSYLAATDLVNQQQKPHVSERDGVVTVSLTHELPHLLACAKVVLKHINAHMMPHPSEWSEAHPQGDDETGSSRMDAITNYKACHLLASQLRQTPGAKLTKMLGLRYLRTTQDGWSALREAAESELAALHLPEHTVEAFLDEWALAVDGEDAQLTSLVWAVDFRGELEARKVARIAEVRERRDRMSRDEDESQLIRSAVAAEKESGAGERVVELAGSSE